MGSYYAFTSVTRLEAEEMGKRQDQEFVTMLLKDLKEVNSEARESMENSIESYRRKALNKVSEEQRGPAESYFNEESASLVENPQALLQKRRPAAKKKRPSSRMPSNRPHRDEKKGSHHRRHKPKNKRQ